MISSGRIEAVEETILKRMNEFGPSFRSAIPLSKLVDAILACTRKTEYHEFPNEAVEIATEVANEYGNQASEEFARLLLISLIKRWFKLNPIDGIHGRLEEIRVRETNRMLVALEEPAAGEHVLLKDQFHKDLLCFTGRMIPCGARVVDLRSVVPRRILVSDGLRRLPKNLKFFLRAGGFRPYCGAHLHLPALSEFNDVGFHKSYLCIAELLHRDPALKGMVGMSWFYDPNLEEISPHLAFLRHKPLANGARLFRMGSFAESRRDALANSIRRTKLFNEGRYVPTQFALVWLRGDLLRWAEKQASRRSIRN